MTTLTETIRELRAVMERVEALKVSVCKDDQSRQAHSNQRIDLAAAMLLFEQLAYDQIPTLLDAAERAERYQWRPIETAPRDGTHILLLIDGVAIGGVWECHSEGWETGIPDWYGWDTDNDLIIVENPDTVTHWIPLPPPPEPTGEKS